MIDALSYLFRTRPDAATWTNYGVPHLLLMAAALGGVLVIVRYRAHIPRRRFEIVAGSALLLQAGLMYLWYHVGPYMPWEYGLPFYTCRMSILLYGIGFLTGRRFLPSLALYWGFYGSALALLYIDLHPFAFPHYTYFSYFIGHILLLWSVAYSLFVERFPMTASNLRQATAFSFLFNVGLFVFDHRFGVNYNYLIEAPLWKERLGALPFPLYFLGMQCFFLLVFVVSHAVLAKWQRAVCARDEKERAF